MLHKIISFLINNSTPTIIIDFKLITYNIILKFLIASLNNYYIICINNNKCKLQHYSKIKYREAHYILQLL